MKSYSRKGDNHLLWDLRVVRVPRSFIHVYDALLFVMGLFFFLSKDAVLSNQAFNSIYYFCMKIKSILKTLFLNLKKYDEYAHKTPCPHICTLQKSPVPIYTPKNWSPMASLCENQIYPIKLLLLLTIPRF